MNVVLIAALCGLAVMVSAIVPQIIQDLPKEYQDKLKELYKVAPDISIQLQEQIAELSSYYEAIGDASSDVAAKYRENLMETIDTYYDYMLPMSVEDETVTDAVTHIEQALSVETQKMLQELRDNAPETALVALSETISQYNEYYVDPMYSVHKEDMLMALESSIQAFYNQYYPLDGLIEDSQIVKDLDEDTQGLLQKLRDNASDDVIAYLVQVISMSEAQYIDVNVTDDQEASTLMVFVKAIKDVYNKHILRIPTDIEKDLSSEAQSMLQLLLNDAPEYVRVSLLSMILQYNGYYVHPAVNNDIYDSWYKDAVLTAFEQEIQNLYNEHILGIASSPVDEQDARGSYLHLDGLDEKDAYNAYAYSTQYLVLNVMVSAASTLFVIAVCYCVSKPSNGRVEWMKVDQEENV